MRQFVSPSSVSLVIIVGLTLLSISSSFSSPLKQFILSAISTNIPDIFLLMHDDVDVVLDAVVVVVGELK
jgi:hypothetical protein